MTHRQSERLMSPQKKRSSDIGVAMEQTDRIATAIKEKLEGTQPTCYTCRWRKSSTDAVLGGTWGRPRKIEIVVVRCMRLPQSVGKKDDDFCIYHEPMIDTDKTKWKPNKGD